MKYNKLFILILSISILGGCKKLDDLLVNPNSVDPSLANVDLLLNQAQISFTSVYTTASDFGGQLTRQQQMFGPLYNNAYSPTSFDGMWTTAYTGVIKNTDALLPIAIKQKKYTQAGIAQVLQAYTYGTMVDLFGDIPSSEADQGVAILNPKVDKGADVYKRIQIILDSAIGNFSKSGAAAGPTNDLFYKGNKAKWISAAKTLKLKFYIQTRLVDNTVSDKIKTLLTENNLINNEVQDFVFRYGSQNNTPDSRHPHYASNYNNSNAGSNSVNDFIANYFMWVVAVEKSGTGAVTSLDPRRRYYFYRQRTNYADANVASTPCTIEIKPGHYGVEMPFCLVGLGYWGRDHGDASGTPPDGPLRTAWGMYPAGGEFDASQGTSVDNTRGGKGAGIDPIWISSFTYFLQAEAAQTLGLTINGDARTLLKKGIEASIAKVINFPATLNYTVPASFIPSQANIDTYVNTVLANYDTANNSQKLDIIMREYYIASWGNGTEAYNNYRRTGSPNNMQPVKTTPNPGLFIRSFSYPSVYVNRNINAPAQKNPGVAANKVFWDTNPDNFIK